MPDGNHLWLVKCRRYVWVLADSERDARDKAISELNTLYGAQYYSIDDPEQMSSDIDDMAISAIEEYESGNTTNLHDTPGDE